MTFSWKFPLCTATEIDTSLPITSAQAIDTASGITGFTFPGMMLLPGCNASSSISERPVSGPLFINLRSLDIFIKTKARFFTALDNSAELSCELNP